MFETFQTIMRQVRQFQQPKQMYAPVNMTLLSGPRMNVTKLRTALILMIMVATVKIGDIVLTWILITTKIYRLQRSHVHY